MTKSHTPGPWRRISKDGLVRFRTEIHVTRVWKQYKIWEFDRDYVLEIRYRDWPPKGQTEWRLHILHPSDKRAFNLGWGRGRKAQKRVMEIALETLERVFPLDIEV